VWNEDSCNCVQDPLEPGYHATSTLAGVENDFYNKLEKLNVRAGEKDKILLAHVQRICEAHDTIM